LFEILQDITQNRLIRGFGIGKKLLSEPPLAGWGFEIEKTKVDI